MLFVRHPAALLVVTNIATREQQQPEVRGSYASVGNATSVFETISQVSRKELHFTFSARLNEQITRRCIPGDRKIFRVGDEKASKLN
jgi:hypothetical protein